MKTYVVASHWDASNIVPTTYVYIRYKKNIIIFGCKKQFLESYCKTISAASKFGGFMGEAFLNILILACSYF